MLSAVAPPPPPPPPAAFSRAVDIRFDDISAKARMAPDMAEQLRVLFSRWARPHRFEDRFLRATRNRKRNTARSTTHVLDLGRIDSPQCFSAAKFRKERAYWITPNGWKAATYASNLLFVGECQVRNEEMMYRFWLVRGLGEPKSGEWTANLQTAFSFLFAVDSELELEMNWNKVSKEVLLAVHCDLIQSSLIAFWDKLKSTLPAAQLEQALKYENSIHGKQRVMVLGGSSSSSKRLAAAAAASPPSPSTASYSTTSSSACSSATPSPAATTNPVPPSPPPVLPVVLRPLLPSLSVAMPALSCGDVLAIAAVVADIGDPHRVLQEDKLVALFSAIDGRPVPATAVRELMYLLEAGGGAHADLVVHLLALCEEVARMVFFQVHLMHQPLTDVLKMMLGQAMASTANTAAAAAFATTSTFDAASSSSLQLRAVLHVFARLQQEFPDAASLAAERDLHAFRKRLLVLPEAAACRKRMREMF